MIAWRHYSDGYVDLRGGVLSGVDPHFVPEGYASRAVNLTFRSGVPETRPAFLDPGVTLPDRALRGRFQGAAAYVYAGQTRVAFAVQGDVFSWDPVSNVVVRLTEQVTRRDHTAERFRFIDTGRHLIVQDGINLPMLVQGLNARDSDPSKISPFTGLAGEIGPGTMMAYGYYQLMMVLPFSNQFIIGDPAVPGGQEDNYLMDTLNQYLSGAGAFEVAAGGGDITALKMLPQLDMPEGIGPLLVFTPSFVEAYNVTLPRENWGTQIISQRILARGTPSADSVVIANNDVYFRSRDGIHSIKQGRAAESGRVFQTAARGNQYWLQADAPDLLRYTSGVFFDNRVLMTCAPYRMRLDDGQMDVASAGITSLDLDVERSPRDSAVEIADGLWTGMDVTQLVTCVVDGKDRCFAFVKDADGNNAIREISTLQTGRDFDGLIRSRLYTRAFDVAGILTAKTFGGADVFVSNLADNARIDLSWKADGKPGWNRLGMKAKLLGKCACPCPDTPSNAVPNAFPRISFGTDDQNKTFFRSEFKIDTEGQARLNALRVQGLPAKSEQAFQPSEAKVCESVEACPDNDYALGALT